MRTFMQYLLVSFLAFFVLPIGNASAATGPDAVIKEIIGKLKQTGSPIALMDYIHWDSVLQTLPEKLKAAKKFKNSAELKIFYTQAFQDPAKFLSKQLEEGIDKIPADRREMARKNMGMIISSINQKLEAAKDQVRRTDFEIGEVKQEGDKADVEVIGKLDGKEKRQHLKLAKLDGKWLLTTLDFGAAAGVPVGATTPQ